MLSVARHAFDLARRYAPEWAHKLRRVDANGDCIVEDASGYLWLAHTLRVNAGDSDFTRPGMASGRDGQWQVRRVMLVPVYGPVRPETDAAELSALVRAA